MTEDFMAMALAEAKLGLQEGGLPIGAALVVNDKLVGLGRNRRVQQKLHSSRRYRLPGKSRQTSGQRLPPLGPLHHPVTVRYVRRRHPALRHS